MDLLISIIILPVFVAIIGLLGYFIGIIISVIPLLNDIFTMGLGLEHSAIPTLMAWAFLFVSLMTVFVKGSD